MKLSEALGRNGKAIKAWLDLLPDGEYTSVVCGSFKLVIMVGTNLHEYWKDREISVLLLNTHVP